jgi:hypothetical protein
MLPTCRIAPQSGNGNDLDSLGGRLIEESVWEDAPYLDSTERISASDSVSRTKLSVSR